MRVCTARRLESLHSCWTFAAMHFMIPACWHGWLLPSAVCFYILHQTLNLERWIQTPEPRSCRRPWILVSHRDFRDCGITSFFVHLLHRHLPPVALKLQRIVRLRIASGARAHGDHKSEGGMRSETLIELKFLNSSFCELILLLKLDKQFPVEQFEATDSQSTASSRLGAGRQDRADHGSPRGPGRRAGLQGRQR